MAQHSRLSDHLVKRIAGFARLARMNGYPVGVEEQVSAQQLVMAAGFDDLRALRWGLRSLLCSCRDDWLRFDELFDAYWLPGRKTRSGSGSQFPLPRNRQQPGDNPLSGQSPPMADRNDPDGSDSVADPGTRAGASCRESLMHTDFRDLRDDQQMRAVEQLAERLARRLRRRMLRRQRTATRQRIDLRKTARDSLRYGGLPIRLAYRQPRQQMPRVVILVDVSRSMSLYSLIFLRFARGLLAAFREADAYAFHTRLTPVGDALRQQDFVRLQHSLVIVSQGWSGGTRIGACLAEFNRHHAARLEKNTLLIVVSDGLDTGPADDMARELGKMRQRCRRLVWLSPLLGRPGYEPRTASMLAALPLIDLFAPAHSLASLLALEHTLTQL